MWSILSATAGFLHLWTILIAWQESGVFGAVLTCFLPVLAEVYWFFSVGPLTLYGIMLLVWVGILVACLICLGISALLFKDGENSPPR